MTGKINKNLDEQIKRAERLKNVPEIRPWILRGPGDKRTDRKILLDAGYTEQQIEEWSVS